MTAKLNLSILSLDSHTLLTAPATTEDPVVRREGQSYEIKASILIEEIHSFCSLQRPIELGYTGIRSLWRICVMCPSILYLIGSLVSAIRAVLLRSSPLTFATQDRSARERILGWQCP